MPTTFQRGTALTHLGDGVYDGALDPAFGAANGPHGGYVAAVLLRALTAAVDDPGRPVRALTIHYVSPAMLGERVRLETAIERTGKSMTNASVRASQQDRLVAYGMAAFSAAREDIVPFDDAPLPTTKRPEDGIVFPQDAPGYPEFGRRLEYRGVIGARPFSGAPEARLGSWVRMREPEPVDAPIVAMYADAMAPAMWPRVTTPVMSVTVDLTIHFRLPLPDESHALDAWHLIVAKTRAVRDGFADIDADIWDPAGRCIAHGRQLAVVRPFSF